eukprot:s6828_g2.t3
MIQRTAQPPQPYSAYKPNTLSPTRPKVLRLPPWPCAFAGDSRDAAADYPVIQKGREDSGPAAKILPFFLPSRSWRPRKTATLSVRQGILHTLRTRTSSSPTPRRMRSGEMCPPASMAKPCGGCWARPRVRSSPTWQSGSRRDTPRTLAPPACAKSWSPVPLRASSLWSWSLLDDQQCHLHWSRCAVCDRESRAQACGLPCGPVLLHGLVCDRAGFQDGGSWVVFLLRGRLDVEGFGRLRGPHILVGGHGRHLAGYLRGAERPQCYPGPAFRQILQNNPADTACQNHAVHPRVPVRHGPAHAGGFHNIDSEITAACRNRIGVVASKIALLSFPSLFERRDTKTLQQPFWALMLLTLVVYGSMRHLLDALKKRGASEEVVSSFAITKWPTETEIKELTAFKTPPKCIRLAMEGVACLLEKPRKSWEAPKGREAKPEDAQDLGVSENPKW